VNDELKRRIRSREPLLGTFLNLGSAMAAEACALAGFDFVVIDLEHGSGDESVLAAQVLAVEAHRVPPIVRVESVERIRSGRALDLGAAGAMFPRLRTAEEAAGAIRHLKYPPEGDRGVATYNRACGFGLHPENLDSANDDVVGVVQIETVAAVENVEAISRVDGVDCLFVGPRDLSHALGVPGKLDAPAYQAAIDAVAAAATSAGIAAGILVPDVDEARRHLERGFAFIAIGSDSTFVARASQDTVSSFSSLVAAR